MTCNLWFLEGLICENSSLEDGIRLGEDYNNMLNEIKAYNYEKIYHNKKFDVYRNYVKSVIRSIYQLLIESYDEQKTITTLLRHKKAYPKLINDFVDFLDKYVSLDLLGDHPGAYKRYQNDKIYGCLDSIDLYLQAIIDFISGMTDRYAIEVYNELLRY